MFLELQPKVFQILGQVRPPLVEIKVSSTGFDWHRLEAAVNNKLDSSYAGYLNPEHLLPTPSNIIPTLSALARKIPQLQRFIFVHYDPVMPQPPFGPRNKAGKAPSYAFTITFTRTRGKKNGQNCVELKHDVTDVMRLAEQMDANDARFRKFAKEGPFGGLMDDFHKHFGADADPQAMLAADDAAGIPRYDLSKRPDCEEDEDEDEDE